MIRTRIAAALVGALLVSLFTIGCGDKGADGETPQQFDIKIVCEKCGATDVAKVSDALSNLAWPIDCPKCDTAAAYHYVECISCGKPVPQKDPQTGQFGSPENCPHCGRQPQP